MKTVDINCDMGESFGRYKLGNDQELIQLVNSVNIACGFHAGDPSIMDETVRLALKHSVHIGAHPGFPDLNGFGRRHMEITPQYAYQMTLYQIGALNAFVTARGGKLHHVKPHGALYNFASSDAETAQAIVDAVYDFDSTLILIGLANSTLAKVGEQKGLTVFHEVFADRTYQDDGTLTPRSQPNATISDLSVAMEQVKQMVFDHSVTSVNGKTIPIKSDTICLHGDGPHVLTFANSLNKLLR